MKGERVVVLDRRAEVRLTGGDFTVLPEDAQEYVETVVEAIFQGVLTAQE